MSYTVTAARKLVELNGEPFAYDVFTFDGVVASAVVGLYGVDLQVLDEAVELTDLAISMSHTMNTTTTKDGKTTTLVQVKVSVTIQDRQASEVGTCSVGLSVVAFIGMPGDQENTLVLQNVQGIDAMGSNKTATLPTSVVAQAAIAGLAGFNLGTSSHQRIRSLDVSVSAQAPTTNVLTLQATAEGGYNRDDSQTTGTIDAAVVALIATERVLVTPTITATSPQQSNSESWPEKDYRFSRPNVQELALFLQGFQLASADGDSSKFKRLRVMPENITVEDGVLFFEAEWGMNMTSKEQNGPTPGGGSASWIAVGIATG